MFTTSQSLSRSLFFSPNHQHYGQSIDSTMQGQKPSERLLPLRLSVSRPNEFRQQTRKEMSSYFRDGVSSTLGWRKEKKKAFCDTLHVNVHIFCWQTLHDCSTIIYAVNFPFMLTETHLHKRYKSAESLLKCSIYNDEKDRQKTKQGKNFSYSSIRTDKNDSCIKFCNNMTFTFIFESILEWLNLQADL